DYRGRLCSASAAFTAAIPNRAEIAMPRGSTHLRRARNKKTGEGFAAAVNPP
ncbi:MAG: hypothetical protein ACI8PZ_004164, partial [Myxococcota bacterium]